MKSTLYVEQYGRQIDDKTMQETAKAIWVEAGNKIKDILTLDIYAKPEENKVYFVINGDFTGSFDF